MNSTARALLIGLGVVGGIAALSAVSRAQKKVFFRGISSLDDVPANDMSIAQDGGYVVITSDTFDGPARRNKPGFSGMELRDDTALGRLYISIEDALYRGTVLHQNGADLDGGVFAEVVPFGPGDDDTYDYDVELLSEERMTFATQQELLDYLKRTSGR